jgi:hypothetical protein
VAKPEQVAESRFAGLGDALKIGLLVALAVAVGVGGLAAIIAWAAGRNVSGAIAITYYIVGCILVIVGMFPTGGFSMIRGTITRRRPTGTGPKPAMLLGLILIGLGAVADFTRPF